MWPCVFHLVSPENTEITSFNQNSLTGLCCRNLWPHLAELLLCTIHQADHIFGYLLSFHAVAEGEWNSSRGLLHTDSLWRPWINTVDAQNSSWTRDSILAAVVWEWVRGKKNKTKQKNSLPCVESGAEWAIFSLYCLRLFDPDLLAPLRRFPSQDSQTEMANTSASDGALLTTECRS